jgi:hypothetical protein
MVFTDSAVYFDLGVAKGFKIAHVIFVAFERDDVELAVLVFDLRIANVEVASAGVGLLDVVYVRTQTDIGT